MADERENRLIHFMAITNTSRLEAEGYLARCHWDVQLALDYFLAKRTQKLHFGGGTPLPPPPPPPSLPPIGKSNGGGGGGLYPDDVRSPIAPKTEVLIHDFAPPYGHSPYVLRPIFSPYREWNRAPPAQYHPTPSPSPPPSEGGKVSPVDALLHPPLDLVHVGTFTTARQQAEYSRKWLLVDVYNPGEFACSVLNRDVWRHPEVCRLIKKLFVFWQVSPFTTHGQNYINFYHVRTYPHVSILDPRTGESMMTWGRGLTATKFCDDVAKFLAKHPDFGRLEGSGKTPKSSQEPMSEEERLKAAIALSLENLDNNKQRPNSKLSRRKLPNTQQLPESPGSKKSDWTSTKASSLSSGKSSDSSSSPATTAEKPLTITPDAYKAHLGPSSGAQVPLLFHLPNGRRLKAKFPIGSKLLALYLYIGEKCPEYVTYSLRTNYPKKVFPRSEEITLEKAGLRPRDTIYLQPPD